MFGHCGELTKIAWPETLNTSKVTKMIGMFSNCTSLTSLDLSSFNTEKVTSMSGMFKGCTSLTSLDLSSFNTSNVTNMYGTFNNCSKLKTINVGKGWSTALVTNSNDMFTSCTSLVGGAGTPFSSEHIDKEYARVDGGASSPGYLTGKYTVTYDSNGGTGAMDAQSFIQGTQQKLTKNAFTKNGYKFSGWNTDKSASTHIYTDEQETTFSQDTTLYAIWTLTEYTITYDLDGGTAPTTPNPTTYTIETADITLNSPTKTDWAFAGFYDNAGAGKLVTKIAKGSTGDLSLKAKWNPAIIPGKTGPTFDGVTGKISYTKGNTSNCTITIDRDITPETLEYLQNNSAIYLDGSTTALAKENYKIDSGSTILTLFKDPCLKNLSVGTHTFKIDLKYGEKEQYTYYLKVTINTAPTPYVPVNTSCK